MGNVAVAERALAATSTNPVPAEPSIWSTGGSASGPGGKLGSTLCIPAASALMGLLYGARMARYDLLRPVQSLACFLHDWNAECDARLLRLVSYVNSSLHIRQVGWVGDDVSKIGPHLYADADFAGCPRTLRSTTGYHLVVEGTFTNFAQTGASSKQTALSNSTPEAEFAACHLAHKKAFIPALDLWDKLFPAGYSKVVHEDNQAMIQVALTGVNKTMRWLSRNHGLAIRHLYDHLGNEETKDETRLVYTRSEWMAADIYTKMFAEKDKWLKACELVNIIDPVDIKEVILRRSEIFKQMEADVYRHLNNIKPNSSNSATHRKWMREGDEEETACPAWEIQQRE
jgi:hypothetical protein